MAEPTRDPQGPPKDVDASELWLALNAIPTPHKVIDFPMKVPFREESIGKVAVVPLGPEDLMVCRKQAGEWTSKLTGESPKAGEESPAYKDCYGDEVVVQILWRALKDPKDPKLERPAFAAPSLLRRRPFTADILGVLMKSYMRTCVECGPIIATMTDAERDAWLDKIEEGGDSFPFEWCSSGMLTDLLLHSVARTKRLRTANTSSGSPAGASSSDIVSPQPPQETPPIVPESDTPPSVAVDELPK